MWWRLLCFISCFATMKSCYLHFVRIMKSIYICFLFRMLHPKVVLILFFFLSLLTSMILVIGACLPSFWSFISTLMPTLHVSLFLIRRLSKWNRNNVVLLTFAQMEHNTCGLEVLVICQKTWKYKRTMCWQTWWNFLWFCKNNHSSPN